MNLQVSLRSLVAAVMFFAVGVALHEATRAERWPGQHWNTASPSNESPTLDTLVEVPNP